MKKVLSIVLAIAMIATMSAVAFAAETGSVLEESAAATGTATFDVEGTFAAAAHVDKYKVDVSWATDGFTYTEAATVWNTETHKWDETAGASWAGSGTITVANHSSKKITATPSWEAVDGGNVVMGFTAAVEVDPCEATAEGAEKTTAPSKTITATITSGAIAATGDIGTITVTIA